MHIHVDASLHVYKWILPLLNRPQGNISRNTCGGEFTGNNPPFHAVTPDWQVCIQCSDNCTSQHMLRLFVSHAHVHMHIHVDPS
jgi:hypothetical protein